MNSKRRAGRDDPCSLNLASVFNLSLLLINGEEHLFNVIPYLAYPAFKTLKTIGLFMQAKVAHNTVVWNEEVDTAPESLYLESTPV